MDINIDSSYHEKFRALNIAIVYLFGSYAEDKAIPLSDIDIGIVLMQRTDAGAEENIGKIYNQAYDVFTDIFPSRSLDIVFLHRAPLELRLDVINHGKVLYESSHDDRLDFEERTAILYADFKPLLNEINETILNRVR